MSSIPLSPTSTSTPTPSTKHQERHYNDLARSDDDDDISLAKCMTRKLQSNQQMYPWMSPGLVALYQQHDSPTSRDSIYAINKYSYTQHHQLQLQLQYQQQLMLHYQQQQQQNMTGHDGQNYHRYQRDRQHNSGTKQPVMRKSKSAQLYADHDPKTRMSPTTFTRHVSGSSLNKPSTNLYKKDSQLQRYSLTSLQSDEMTINHHSQRGHHQEQQQQQQQQQQQREINPPKSPVSKKIMNRRSSIYSHASGALSSRTSASNMTDTANGPTTSKNHRKPSLSKRIRSVIMNKSTDKQIHTTSSSASSSLRRSSSVASGASSVTTTKTADNGDESYRSLWTNLLRKSSRSGPVNNHVGKQLVHGNRSNGQKDVALDSPASSISETSYHRSYLHQENYYIDDLPSPASSTSPELPLNYSTDQHGNNSLQKIESFNQPDYFALSSSPSQHQQMKNETYSLQHGSPRLRPSSNNQQISRSLLVDESDGLPTSFLETSVHSNKVNSPVTALSPISSTSSSASTSASSLALEYQQSVNTKIATKSFSTKPKTKIQFATTIQVHDTFGSQDYDRRCDTQVTCQRLTTVMALQIKKELNEYKLNEMEVHLQSRQNTQFFL